MTAGSPRPTDEPVRSGGSVVSLGLAAALVVVVVGAVLLFGVDRPPSVASLDDEPSPAPSAAIAWTAERGERSCARVAWPDGGVTEPRCERGGGEVTGWTDDGLVMRRWDEDQARIIDPRTGETLGRTSGTWDHAGGTDVVWTEFRDGELVVRLEEDDTELWRVASSERYDIHTSARSADGRWVALVDVAERLLVVPSDGSAAPRQWASGVHQWQRPQWEGTGAPR